MRASCEDVSYFKRMSTGPTAQVDLWELLPEPKSGESSSAVVHVLRLRLTRTQDELDQVQTHHTHTHTHTQTGAHMHTRPQLQTCAGCVPAGCSMHMSLCACLCVSQALRQLDDERSAHITTQTSLTQARQEIRAMKADENLSASGMGSQRTHTHTPAAAKHTTPGLPSMTPKRVSIAGLEAIVDEATADLERLEESITRCAARLAALQAEGAQAAEELRGARRQKGDAESATEVARQTEQVRVYAVHTKHVRVYDCILSLGLSFGKWAMLHASHNVVAFGNVELRCVIVVS